MINARRVWCLLSPLLLFVGFAAVPGTANADVLYSNPADFPGVYDAWESQNDGSNSPAMVMSSFQFTQTSLVTSVSWQGLYVSTDLSANPPAPDSSSFTIIAGGTTYFLSIVANTTNPAGSPYWLWMSGGDNGPSYSHYTTGPVSTLSRTFSIDGVAVPEPSSIVTLTLGVAGIFGLRRRGRCVAPAGPIVRSVSCPRLERR
jgi:PEP-CTERM motif